MVFILADDWDYSSFPIHASDSPPEMKGYRPNGHNVVDNDLAFDQVYPTLRRVMIEEGLYLHRHYAASVCTPSRKQLLTGRSVWSQGNGEWEPIRPRYSLLSDKLKQQGYVTHMVGKYHVGEESRRSWPRNRGFDTSIGFHSPGLGDHATWMQNKKHPTSIMCKIAGDADSDVVYDLIFNDTQPPDGTIRVDAQESTWPGSDYIRKGQVMTTYEMQEVDATVRELHKEREEGDPDAIQKLRDFGDALDSTNYVTKTIQEQTVKAILDSRTPFFVYASTPAMRTSGLANDFQRQRVVDTLGTFEDGDCVWDPDRQPQAGDTSMREFKRRVEEYGGDWSAVQTAYTLNGCNKDLRNERFKTYAFASTVDDLLNATVDALHQKGVWEETLVVFTADNGGRIAEKMLNNFPLRGGKNSFLEGGIRMHTAVSGGFLPLALRGKISNALTSNVDWWPTLSWLSGSDPYYDPREDHQDYGRSGFAPNAVDGLVMVHSWNKLIEGGQAADEYVNGIHRYIYHYGMDGSLPPESVYSYASQDSIFKVYQSDITIPHTTAAPGPCGPDDDNTAPMSGVAIFDPNRIPVNVGCTAQMVKDRVYPCGLSTCEEEDDVVCPLKDPCIYDLVEDPYEKNALSSGPPRDYSGGNVPSNDHACTHLPLRGASETSCWRYPGGDTGAGRPGVMIYTSGLNGSDVQHRTAEYNQLFISGTNLTTRCNTAYVGYMFDQDVEPDTLTGTHRTSSSSAPIHLACFGTWAGRQRSLFCEDPSFYTRFDGYSQYMEGELLRARLGVATLEDVASTCAEDCWDDARSHSITVNLEGEGTSTYSCQMWRVQEASRENSVHVYYGSAFGGFYREPMSFIKKLPSDPPLDEGRRRRMSSFPRPPWPTVSPRATLGDRNGYLASAHVQSIRGRAMRFYENVSISPPVRGVHRTDVAILVGTCGRVCAVDERIASAVRYERMQCRSVSFALASVFDDDVC